MVTDGIDDSTQRNLGTITPRPGTLQQEADTLKGKNNVKVFAIGFQGMGGGGDGYHHFENNSLTWQCHHWYGH